MKPFQSDQPIRVVKKKVAHAGHHGGAWKVAYADFVTAMMALFIVLWIVGQSKQIKQYVAYYFRDPGVFAEAKATVGITEGNQGTLRQSLSDEILRKQQKKKLTEMAESILHELGKNKELKLMLNQVKMEIVKEGLRIELVDSSESFFFDIGTATLKHQAAVILQTIAHQVGTLPNHIIIEGHTDSRQYSSVVGYTNFELSADRANSARRVLATNGLRPGQIDEVRGYADSKLKNKNDPYDVRNRRISVIIKFVGNSEHD